MKARIVGQMLMREVNYSEKKEKDVYTFIVYDGKDVTKVRDLPKDVYESFSPGEMVELPVNIRVYGSEPYVIYQSEKAE